MMKNDDRVGDVWTRDGVINYISKTDGLVYKIHKLFDGGGFHNYNITDAISCFSEKGVFQVPVNLMTQEAFVIKP